MRPDDDISINNRLAFTLTGAMAGLCFWALIEYLDRVVDNTRLYAFTFAATLAFFASLLAMMGPVRWARAIRGAFVTAVFPAALLVVASYRFADVEDYLQTGHPIVAYVLLFTLPVPFLIALERGRDGWRDYAALFDHAWSIVVRYAAAWLFVAVFWSVIYLSDALLQIVGLDIIEDLLQFDPVPFVLTGAALGVALAVVDELSDYVTPYLLLRLMRLLLPVFLVVVAVFIVALPIRGLSDLFGGFSTAAILMSIAIGSITLISTAIDRNNEEAVQGKLMLYGVQGLIVMTPVIAFLAVYAIWVRVEQYGWSPDRFAAAISGCVLFVYAACYLVVTVLRVNWMERLRQVNIFLAIGVIALAALFLTPVLDVQRMSAQSQVSRFMDGRTDVEVLDLWAIKHDWGVAGQNVIADLSALTDHPQAERLQERLVAAEKSNSRYEYTAQVENDAAEPARNDLRAIIPVFAIPGGGAAALPKQVLESIPSLQVKQLQAGCARKTPGDAPGCVIVAVDLVPTSSGREYLAIFMLGKDRVQMFAMKQLNDDQYQIDHSVRDLGGSPVWDFDSGLIDAIHAGSVSVKPSGINALSIGGQDIIVSP